MMFLINSISLDPYTSGSAGQSARPSVFCNQGETFTPVERRGQPSVRSGFYPGNCGAASKKQAFPRPLRIDRSTESGKASTAVKCADGEFSARSQHLCNSFHPLSLAAVVSPRGGVFSLSHFG